MGAINSKECEKWRNYCIFSPVFPTYGVMETRYNQEIDTTYFPTLSEFISEVLEAIRMEADLSSQALMPNLDHCEEEAVPYIIVGLSQFWREKFPFEETIKFTDIQEAASKFADEEAAWISQHFPIKMNVATSPPRLRSVVVIPDKTATEIIRINVDNKQAGRDDVLDLIDTDPIPLPTEKASKEYNNNKKVKLDATSPSYKAYYKERLATDPDFAAQEKLRQKLNFKERRRRKRVEEALIRQEKKKGIQGGTV